MSWLIWAALVCWACVILWLSSLPPEELPEAAFLFWDKVNHFVAYAVGGWLAASALQVSRPRNSRTTVLILAVLLIATFGVLDEALQTLTPGRTGGAADDWMADVLGAAVGALLRLRRTPRTTDQIPKRSSSSRRWPPAARPGPRPLRQIQMCSVPTHLSPKTARAPPGC
jgi:VanZ family protein